MFFQLMGLVDAAVALFLIVSLISNPIALIIGLLLLIKGISSFINIFPASNYVIHFCAAVDLLAAGIILFAFGFSGFLTLFFFYYLIKSLWSFAFGVIFN